VIWTVNGLIAAGVSPKRAVFVCVAGPTSGSGAVTVGSGVAGDTSGPRSGPLLGPGAGIRQTVPSA
jgi:hypothetical protein